MKILLSIFFIIGTSSARSQMCLDFFIKNSVAVNVEKERSDLIQAMKTNNLHGFIVRTQGGDIPAVLMTEKSYGFLKAYLERSFGTQIMTKKGWPNDHGSLRYQEHLIDAYIAGQRQFGEIYQTGISWKTAYDSIKFIDKIADVIIESSFALTKEEMDKVDFYQRVRRAAFVRIVFPMGDLSIYNRLENVLTECREHCFGFSSANNLEGQKLAIQKRVGNLLPNGFDISQIYMRTQSLVLEMRTELLNMDIRDEQTLNKEKIVTPERIQKLQKMLDIELPTESAIQLMYYLLSLEATQQYGEVISSINPHHDLGATFENKKRLTAILIWADANQADNINALNYQIRGTSFSFSNRGNWIKLYD